MKAEELLAHAAVVRSMVRGILSDHQDAEDIVQEVILVMMEHSQAPDRAWIRDQVHHVIVRRLPFAILPKAARIPPLDENIPFPGLSAYEKMERDEVHHLLEQAMRNMNEPYRTAIEMCFYEELPAEVAARHMGVQADTFRSYVNLGLANLRGQIVAFN